MQSAPKPTLPRALPTPSLPRPAAASAPGASPAGTAALPGTAPVISHLAAPADLGADRIELGHEVIPVQCVKLLYPVEPSSPATSSRARRSRTDKVSSRRAWRIRRLTR